MITYDINVLIGKDDPNKDIYVKRHDTGINFRVFLKSARRISAWRYEESDYMIPENSTAVMTISKPDGTCVLVEGIASSSNVFIKIPDKSTAFAVSGIASAEVSIYDENGRRITSATFNVEVLEECACDCEEDSGNYIDLLGDTIKEIKEAADVASASETSASESAKTSEAAKASAMDSASAARSSAEEAGRSALSSDTSAKASEKSAQEAKVSEEVAKTSADKSKTYSEEAKEAWHEVKEHKSHFANALVGNARGNPVVVSDFSPHSHTVECVAERKNLFPNFITDRTYTNGSFVKVNADGSITVHKVAGDTINTYFMSFVEGGTYTLSNGLDKGCDVYFQVGNNATVSYPKKTFTVESGEIRFYLYSSTSTELAEDITLYPQLEKGTVATPYTPYLESVEGLEVKVYGKNLLSDAVYDLNNFVRDEGISINSRNSKVYYLDEIPNGTYTISAKANDTGVYLYFYYSKDGGATWEAYNGKSGVHYILASSTPYTITFEKTDNTRFLIWKHDVNLFNRIDYIQIEAGATATAYEPYKASFTYTTDADGRAELLSVADTMTIVSDARAVLDVSYQRDINSINTVIDLNAVESQINAAKQETGAKIASTNQVVESHEGRISAIESWIGCHNDLIITNDNNGVVEIPQGAQRYAQLLELQGWESIYNQYDYYDFILTNPIKKIQNDNGDVLFELTSSLINSLADFGIQGNYIYFDDGKAYYKQTTKKEVYFYECADGEKVLREVYDGGCIVLLANPIITDISSALAHDGIIDISGCKYLTIVTEYTEEEVMQIVINNPEAYSQYWDYVCPKVKIAVEDF